MKELSHRFHFLKNSIFSEITKLVYKFNATDLSMGFPDFDPPDFIKEKALQAMEKSFHQYSPSAGQPLLKNVLQELYLKNHSLNYNPDKEISINIGATEGLYLAFLMILRPEDEIIVFEPYFDLYKSLIDLTGAKIISYPLNWPDFQFDQKILASLITPKTKAILINSPHNPTGKVFSKEELIEICHLIVTNDLWCISDEVYEFLIYEENCKHYSPASFPMMKDRTIIISSAGKALAATGWKIGWALGPEELISEIKKFRQYTTHSACSPMQIAVAESLQALPNFLPETISQYKKKCNFLISTLELIKWPYYRPHGGYFIVANIAQLNKDALSFCFDCIKDPNIGFIPLTPFYSSDHPDKEKLIRISFCKTNSTLEQASQKLINFFTPT